MTADTPKPKRLWELDFSRGIAIVLVMLFHVFYDLKHFFGFTEWQYDHGFWYFERKLAGGSFVFLAGVASALIGRRYGYRQTWVKNGRRGGRLIALGMLITLVTWFFDPGMTVWFGILHFLGLAILLSTLFLRFRLLNLILGLLVIGAGNLILPLRAESAWGLLPGIRPYGFQSFDYYPLFPWFGVMLLGIGIGNLVYSGGIPLMKRSPVLFEKPLIWMGKRSLFLYLVHPPLFLGILWLLLG